MPLRLCNYSTKVAASSRLIKRIGISKFASSLRSPSAKANSFLAFGDRKLLSRGHWPLKFTYRKFKVASSLRSPSAKANLFLAFGERKLLSRGHWPLKFTYRKFKVASSLRSPSAKANLFLAFGERKLPRVAAFSRLIKRIGISKWIAGILPALKSHQVENPGR
jgi:hypothetical protein